VLPESNTHTAIRCATQDFSTSQLNWWKSFGISIKTLQLYNVYSVSSYWINDRWYEKKCYGYYGGKKDDIEYWKLYFPGERIKFLSNWTKKMIQGWTQLDKHGDILVITKSLKDVMLFHELGINSIAPLSETCALDRSFIINTLSKRFKRVCVMYDNDIAGIEGMIRVKKMLCEKKKCNILFFWIPRRYKAKDITDFYKMYGYDKTIELINYARKSIGN
jgi:hypothetical protein